MFRKRYLRSLRLLCARGDVIEIMDTQPVPLPSFHVVEEPSRIPSHNFRVEEDIEPEDDPSIPTQDFRVEEDKETEDDPSKPSQDFRAEEDKEPEDDPSKPAQDFRVEEEEEERPEDDHNSSPPKFGDIPLEDSYREGRPILFRNA